MSIIKVEKLHLFVNNLTFSLDFNSVWNSVFYRISTQDEIRFFISLLSFYIHLFAFLAFFVTFGAKYAQSGFKTEQVTFIHTGLKDILCNHQRVDIIKLLNRWTLVHNRQTNWWVVLLILPRQWQLDHYNLTMINDGRRLMMMIIAMLQELVFTGR